MKAKKLKFVIVASIFLASLTIVAVGSLSAGQSSNTIVYANPLIGNDSFVDGARGFVAANGFAYSYVAVNASLLRRGDTISMHPAINGQIPSATNLTVIITYGGLNDTNGVSSFYISIPAFGYYGVASGNDFAHVADEGSNVGPGVTLHFVVRPSSEYFSLWYIFVYIGPSKMPNVVSLGY